MKIPEMGAAVGKPHIAVGVWIRVATGQAEYAGFVVTRIEDPAQDCPRFQWDDSYAHSQLTEIVLDNR